MINTHTTDSTEQEKRARIILDRAYDAFIEIDINHVIVDWNLRAEITFGWTREQVIGKTLDAVIIPARYRKAQKAGLKQFQTQATIESTISNKQIEFIARRSDGQEFAAEMTVFPVGTGKTVNLGAFIRNISGRRIAEQAVSESEDKFRLLVSGVTDYAIIMLDPQGIVKTWNEGAHRIKGYTAEEIVGKHSSCFHTSEDKANNKSKTILESAIKFGRYEEDAQRLRKDGSRFLANVVVNPIYDEHHKLIGFAKVTRDISEWKAANHAVNRLLELAPDAMVIINQQGNIILVNSETENIFGYNKEELVGLTVEKLIPDRSKFLDAHRLSSKNKGFELYALRKDGTEFPVEISLNPMETDQGLLISTAIRDVTERKQFESDLKKQKELFQIILDNLVDGVIVADSQGKFLVINRTAQSMTGIDYIDIPVDKWSEKYGLYLSDTCTLYPSQDLPLVRAMHGQTVVAEEIFIRNAHVPLGTWLSVSAAPMEIEDGASKVGIMIFHDISKNKRIEQKNAQLAAIVESTDDTITGSSLDGTIISWNNAATRMFGHSKDEAIGQADSITIPADRLEEEASIIKELMSEKVHTKHYETIRQAKNGNLIPVSLTISPIRDQAGKIIGTSKITRDITERKKAEHLQVALAEELRRSNAELQQFASVASHDLQEPLRGVAGCLEIIEETYRGKGDDKVDKLMRHAIDGALRMHMLIEDLLSLSRVTTTEIAIQSTDMSKVLDRALENLEVPIKESKAIITCDALPTLAVDSTQLVQLFQNLISNAIKFRATKQLKIHVGAKCDNGNWLFFVRDNGIGFKQEFTDRIFLPFNRLHTRDKYPGTGIGLAICQRIVERHKGSIWAESEEGQGTTFYFTLNLSQRKL